MSSKEKNNVRIKRISLYQKPFPHGIIRINDKGMLTSNMCSALDLWDDGCMWAKDRFFDDLSFECGAGDTLDGHGLIKG